MRGVALGVMAVMLLNAAGCSAMAERKTSVVTDVDKVALVNATARNRGIEVVWVNPPRKVIEKKSQSEASAKN